MSVGRASTCRLVVQLASAFGLYDLLVRYDALPSALSHLLVLLTVMSVGRASTRRLVVQLASAFGLCDLLVRYDTIRKCAFAMLLLLRTSGMFFF